MGQSEPFAKLVVLVVEDEPLLRLVAVEMVEDGGFEALEVDGSNEAIRILEVRLDIRLVFTDIDMPGGVNGLKLAAIIRDRWPPIAIISIWQSANRVRCRSPTRSAHGGRDRTG